MKIRENPFFPAKLPELAIALGVYWRELAKSLDAIAWDDLRFPAQGINPAGTSNAPSVDTTTWPGTLLFSNSANNHIAGVAQMPHAWRRGSAVRPHVHWSKTSTGSGGVQWELRYSVAEIGAVFPAVSAWTVGVNAVSDSNTTDKHALDAFPDITMDSMKESAIILWEVRRNTDATADTYAAPARLLEFDFHYQREKNGTESEIPT